MNFYIDAKVSSFCEITPSKSAGNYWQNISDNNKTMWVDYTEIAASNASMDMHSVHFRYTLAASRPSNCKEVNDFFGRRSATFGVD